MLNIQAFKWGVICSWILLKRWLKESKHKPGHPNTNTGFCIIQSYCFCFVLAWRCQENIWRALIFFKFARRVYFDRNQSKTHGKIWIVAHICLLMRKHPSDQLLAFTLLTTFWIEISYKWYLFGKPKCAAIGFWNDFCDGIIRRLIVLDIARPDLYGGPCICCFWTYFLWEDYGFVSAQISPVPSTVVIPLFFPEKRPKLPVPYVLLSKRNKKEIS